MGKGKTKKERHGILKKTWLSAIEFRLVNKNQLSKAVKEGR